MKIKQMSPQLLVANLERSLAYYCTELGFEIDFRYEDFYAGISSQGYSIHLKLGNPYQIEDHLDLYFSVDAIGELFETFKERPVTIIQELREMPYGREFYIADPDGYILGFIETE